MKAISSLGIVPIIASEDVIEYWNSDKPASNYFDFAIHLNCNINFCDFQNVIPACFIVPVGLQVDAQPQQKIIYEVVSLKDAEWALAQNPYGLIIKGNEASGLVGDDSVFILFQKVSKIATCPIWLRGGVGVHTSAAALSLGAQGVVLEDECFLFPEFGVNKDLKALIARFDGSETRIEHGQRFYVNQPYWPKGKSKDFIDENFLVESLSEVPTSKSALIQFGQSVGLAKNYLERFATLSNFITQINWSQQGHLQQAQQFAANSINQQRFKTDFGVELAVAQGPMTRVSDEPEFTNACLLYTSPSPRDRQKSRMPSSA